MLAFAAALALAPVVISVYAYVIYPAALWLISRAARRRPLPQMHAWPTLTVTIPVYNAGDGIRATLDHLLALDYPRDRMQLLVLSDASTDSTDDIVREYSHRGVELFRAVERRGKTALENAAVAMARGELIVNVDATVVVPPHSLKRLVAAFADPSVGVASGRDVSVGASETTGGGEGGYVGYEMWVRDLETRVGSIVGASGCFFAIRREVHADAIPRELSWDFASALVARQLGFRAVSVPDAVCVVPRTAQIRTEFRRKARTMARGLGTLFHFGALMNPLRFGGFAFMLVSHKLLRWLPYLLLPISLIALALLAPVSAIASLALLGVAGVALLGVPTMRSSTGSSSSVASLCGFVVAASTAGFLAWYYLFTGARMAIWNPTPRPGVSAA